MTSANAAAPPKRRRVAVARDRFIVGAPWRRVGAAPAGRARIIRVESPEGEGGGPRSEQRGPRAVVGEEEGADEPRQSLGRDAVPIGQLEGDRGDAELPAGVGAEGAGRRIADVLAP